MSWIYNYEDNTVVTGTSEDDSISNDGDSVTIDGGAVNDYIQNYYGDSVTIDGGAGNDYIYNYGNNVLIEYASGDGNDSIVGFNETSTLSITGNGINLSDAVIKAHRINITAISLKEAISS